MKAARTPKRTDRGSGIRRPHQIAGWREWIELPELGIARVKAKLDTGARTSTLHAVRMEAFEVEGQEWVRFVVHPRQRTTTGSVKVETPVLEWRSITSSSGHKQRRPVIVTQIGFFGETWPIEITLTNRDSLGFRMLLGREALRNRLVVDSGRSYIGGKLRFAPKKESLEPALA